MQKRKAILSNLNLRLSTVSNTDRVAQVPTVDALTVRDGFAEPCQGSEVIGDPAVRLNSMRRFGRDPQKIHWGTRLSQPGAARATLFKTMRWTFDELERSETEDVTKQGRLAC